MLQPRAKITSAAFALAALFLFAPQANAALYAPGQTLDPSCLPTDNNCGIATTTAASIGAGTTAEIPYYAANGVALSATSSLQILANGDATGNWVGTIAGHAPAYYADATNLTNFGSPFYASFHATTTDALAEGAANLYWTNTRFDNRLSATTSLPNVTTLANLSTVKTSLTGFLKATGGALSTAFINLTSDVTGILPVGNGGTGTMSFTPSGGSVFYNGTTLQATSTLAIGGTGTYGDAPVKIKGFTSNIGAYPFEISDSQSNINFQFEDTGRLNIMNYDATAGAIAVLYNNAASADNETVGHYAYGAKDDAGQANTTAYILNRLTNNSSTTLSSRFEIGWMNNVNDSPGGVYSYSQPNQFLFLSSAGIQIPSGVPLISQNNILQLQGFVGIGTTSPSAILSIQNGGIAIGNTTSGRMTYLSMADNFNTTLSNSGGGSLKFDTGGIDRLSISGSGKVGIGTTSPATQLEVGGSSANVTLDGYLNCSGFTSNANGLLACTASDQRLKQDITPLDASSTLTQLKALNPVSFYWKPGTDRGTQQQYGLIAQQVASVFPDLVSTSSPTALTPDGTLTVNYDGLIAPVIVAIQELMREVDGFAQSITTVVLNAKTGNFTQDLCLGSTCVTEAQLKALLQDSGQAASPLGADNPPPLEADGGGADATSTPSVGTTTDSQTQADTGGTSDPAAADPSANTDAGAGTASSSDNTSTSSPS